MTTLSREDVARLIVRRDPAFREVVRRAGPPPARRNAQVDERFRFLVRSIVAQLLATSAANTIYARVIDACGGDVTVASILAAGPRELKSAGLSRTKASAMVELAEHVDDGRIQIARHGYMDDQAIQKEVTSVRGIGPWTAHMYLMHPMARRDVWPAGDYGVRNGWSLVHDLDELISERALALEGETFTGVRSAVAWYCWQAVHFSRAN